jgi:hypothetical protein
MPVPKCSKCGGNGHNRRTCSKGRAGTPAAGSAQATRAARARPAPAAAATSTALALGKAADLHELRDQLASNLAELDQAIVVFDLIEKTIPEQHVEAARALLVEAGLAKESVTGRHSIVLGKIVASVAATLFAADGPRISQKKVDALVAAADAIGAAQ